MCHTLLRKETFARNEDVQLEILMHKIFSPTYSKKLYFCRHKKGVPKG